GRASHAGLARPPPPLGIRSRARQWPNGASRATAPAERRPSGSIDRALMIPLLVFLLACAAVYFGAIEAASSALMRLSLRLLAERSGRPGHLAAYLDDPVLLFAPLRLLLGLVTAATTALLAKAIGASSFREVALVLISVAAFIVIVE